MTLQRLPVVPSPSPRLPAFDVVMRRHALFPLTKRGVTTLQVNVGKLCNMACQHCHVDAGPKRTEVMPRSVAERVVEVVANNPALQVVDITGGAPELNPNFRFLVTEVRKLGRLVIDRCNLSVFFEPAMADLPSFLASQGVHVIASLPCYQPANVDKQRGKGAFDKSISALRILNQMGYGVAEFGLRLDLVYNPGGAFLPPAQAALEKQYKQQLRALGIQFNGLLTLTNMPINRFSHALERSGQLDRYMQLLVDNFNPSTAPGLMCRSLLSVGHDGRLFDCDFNQMLELELGGQRGIKTIWDFDSIEQLMGSRVATRAHCFGCTAGAGSSCSGALD